MRRKMAGQPSPLLQSCQPGTTRVGRRWSARSAKQLGDVPTADRWRRVGTREFTRRETLHRTLLQPVSFFAPSSASLIGSLTHPARRRPAFSSHLCGEATVPSFLHHSTECTVAKALHSPPRTHTEIHSPQSPATPPR